MIRIIMGAALAASLGAAAYAQTPPATQQQGVDPYHVIGRYAAEATAAADQVAAARQQIAEMAQREAAIRTWWASWWKAMYPEPAPPGQPAAK